MTAMPKTRSTRTAPPSMDGKSDRAISRADRSGKKQRSGGGRDGDYKPLAKAFRRDGFDYDLVTREGDFAIYRQVWYGNTETAFAKLKAVLAKHGKQPNQDGVSSSTVSQPRLRSAGVVSGQRETPDKRAGGQRRVPNFRENGQKRSFGRSGHK